MSTTTGKLAISTPCAANLFTAPIANSVISSSPSLKRLLLRRGVQSVWLMGAALLSIPSLSPKIGSCQRRYKLVNKTVDKCAWPNGWNCRFCQSHTGPMGIVGKGLPGGWEFGGGGTSILSATKGTHWDYGVFLIRWCAYLIAKQLLEKVWRNHDMNMVLD